MNYKFLFVLFLSILIGCKNKTTPKPRSFFRIDFPEKQYITLNRSYPFKFQVPNYSSIVQDKRNPQKNNWINVKIPANKAEIHISYYDLNNNSDSDRVFLAKLIEESRRLAYKHSVKASAIKEQVFINRGANVFGTLYKIEGNAASPMQFFLTDSINHFLRGSLYISATPDIDSLSPVIDFLEKDVKHLVETTSWN